MANTIVNTRINPSKRVAVQYITISSDGSEETDLIVYDSSVVAGLVGITDNLSCALERIEVYASKAANTGTLLFEFDATTDVPAIGFTISSGQASHKACFEDIGGLPNYAGTGKTGDILLTTAGLDAGDVVTIVMTVKV